MALDDERRVYWDSCCFLDYIHADPAKVELLDDLLSASGDGDFQIVTSVLSIAEVAFVAAERGQLDDAVEQAIDGLWADKMAVRMAEFHEGIAREARTLIRKAVAKGWTGLHAADAIHLATARTLKVREIHTYEPKWLRYAEILDGMVICEPTTLQVARVTRPASVRPPGDRLDQDAT